MISQTSTDQSTELAIALQKALNSDKLGTLYALMEDKVPKRSLSKLKEALDNKRTIILHLHEIYGKKKVQRYEVVIDFDKNEVHVGKINLEHVYACSKFEVK
jgi:hypothetical protein